MSEPVTIPNLEGRLCWLRMDEDENKWARGKVTCAWFEPNPYELDDDDDDVRWEQNPTVLVMEVSGGQQWIMQLPHGEIAFCDKPHVDWTVVVEEL